MSNLVTIFEQNKVAFAEALPAHFQNNQKMVDAVMHQVTSMLKRDEKLAKCTSTSVLQSLKTSISLGIVPNTPMGLAYLIPYKDNCTFQLSYKGLMALARRAGDIASIEAHCVYENDFFDCEFGTNTKLTHKPNFKSSRGKFVAVYAVAKYKNGGHQLEVMSIDEINHVKKSSMNSGAGSIWEKHHDEMSKKTVVKRLCKYLELSENDSEALASDNESEKQLVDAQTGEVIEQPKSEKKTKKDLLKDKIAEKVGTMQVPKESGLQEEKNVLTSGRVIEPIDLSSSELFKDIDL